MHNIAMGGFTKVESTIVSLMHWFEASPLKRVESSEVGDCMATLVDMGRNGKLFRN